MNFNRIKILAKLKKISLKDVSENIGLSEQGLHYSITNETLKVVDLEKISIFLNVPVSYFFEDNEIIYNDESKLYFQKAKNGKTITQTIHTGDSKEEFEKFELKIHSLEKEIDSLVREIDLIKDNNKLKDEIIEMLKNKLKQKK